MTKSLFVFDIATGTYFGISDAVIISVDDSNVIEVQGGLMDDSGTVVIESLEETDHIVRKFEKEYQ